MNTKEKRKLLTTAQAQEISKIPLRKALSAQELKKNVLRNIQNHSLSGKVVKKPKPDQLNSERENVKVVQNGIIPKVLGRFLSFRDRNQENRKLKISKSSAKSENRDKPILVANRYAIIPPHSLPGHPPSSLSKPKLGRECLPTLAETCFVDLDAGVADPIKYNEYAFEVFMHLKRLESDFTISKHFMQNQSETDSEKRAELIDWIHRHASRFELYEETFYLTVAIIDLYLQSRDIKPGCLPLLGVSALSIASKYEEIKTPSLNQLAKIAQYRYTRVDIFHMECSILKILDFRVGRPVPIQFLRRYTQANKSGRLVHLLSKFFLELSLFNPELSALSPSLLAASASCLALWVLSEKTWLPHMEFYSGYSAQEVISVTKDLAQYVQSYQTFKVEAVIKKFSGPAFMQVALFPQLASIVKGFAKI